MLYFQMFLLSELKPNQPYTKPIHVMVIKRNTLAQGKEELSLADTSSCIKCISFSEKHSSNLTPNSCVIIRNFKMGRHTLLLNENTVISKAAKLDIPQSVRIRAQQLVAASTLPRKSVSKIKVGDVKEPTTVAGIVAHVRLQFFSLTLTHHSQ